MVAAGGTAGHVVPAIAVAAALRAEGASVTFIGTRERAEAELVPEAGYEIDFLRVRGIDRRNPVRAAGAVWMAGRAVGVARRILRARCADAVLGGGGYVAGVAGRAALRERLPLVLTEADSHMGLANRALARRAARVCLAFPIPGREGARYLVTGRPVPEAISAADRREARSRFGLGEGDRTLLVFGGSLGARSVNLAAVEAFGGSEPAGQGPLHVIHVSGRRDHAELAERLRAIGSPRHYRLLEYEPDLGDALAAADLVLCRAGGSIFEVAAAGRPAILVPYPHATADHQSANARWMTDAGAAVTVPDARLDPAALRELAGSILSDPERLERMAAASRRIAMPDAAKRIAGEVLAAARGGAGAGGPA